MENKNNLYNNVKKILKEIRFGNLTNRLSVKKFPDDKEFLNDFNNMLDALSDREKMIKEYQAIITSKNEYLKSLFNMLNEAAMVLSSDLKIIALNDMQAKLFRKSKKKLIGMNLIEILKKYKIQDISTSLTLTNYETFFQKNRKKHKLSFELRKIKAYLNVSVKQFTDEKGEINYFVVSKDITPEIKSEKMKNTFIATLTHDLKVPIVAEAKVLKLLSSGDFDDNLDFQKQAFQNMILNNNDMMTLVSTLLDVYKIDDGAYTITPKTCDIKELLDNEINKLKYLADDEKCKIIFNANTDKNLINADYIELSRVFRNIISNAIYHAPQNSEVTVEVYDKEDYLYVDISDKGSGISKENIEHIFERYFSMNKKYRKVGTGLGLYLSKKIIQLHNGEIFVKSIPDKITVFTIKLPLKNS